MSILKYRVYRNGVMIAEPTVRNYTDTGLTNGTTYQYQVSAVSEGGEGAKTAAVPGTPVAAPVYTVPGVPASRGATGGDTVVNLVWTAGTNGGSAITGYHIYRGGVSLVTVGTVLAYQDTGRTNGTPYSYTIAAINSIGEGAQTTSVSATPTGSAGATYPTDAQLTFVTVPSAPTLPTLLTPVTDPTWGTKIVRVSNAGVRGDYSRIQPWNSDGSKLRLGLNQQATPHMLNGTTYADLGTFSFVDMAIWSNTDPNKMFGRSGNQLLSQNATTGALTVLHTFTGYSSISIGEYEGGISDDDQYIALIGNFNSSPHLITYNIATNTVIADIVAPSSIGDCQISRLGNYVTLGCGAGTLRYTRNLTSPITLWSRANHCDNALDAAGNEVIVAVADENDRSAVYNLASGAKTLLFPAGTIFDAGHASGHHSRNGWVYLSNYDPTHYGSPGNIIKGRDQVVAVKTDGSGTVEVFGFAHHQRPTDAERDTMTDPQLNIIYAQEPHAAANRNGSKVLFASEWRSGSWSYQLPYAFIASAT